MVIWIGCRHVRSKPTDPAFRAPSRLSNAIEGLETTRQSRVRFQHLIRRPPRGDGSVFEKFDDLDGGQQSFGSRHPGADFLRFGGGLQQRLPAAAPIQGALAGADQHRAHAKRGLGFDAFVGRSDPADPRRAEGEKTAPQRSTKRAESAAFRKN
jgi:hypothetical protein